MAQLIFNCPFCGTQNSAFDVAWWRGPLRKDEGNITEYCLDVFAICRECDSPVCFKLYQPDNDQVHWSEYFNRIRYSLDHSDGSLSKNDYSLEVVVPPSGEINVPEFLPKNVDESFRKAKELERQDKFLEEAATNYRKTLERAIKATYPQVYETKGDRKISLYNAIKCLVKDGKIPDSMGKLAQGIRLIGNAATHSSGEDDASAITREEVDDIASFTEAFLTYLISLPEKLHRRFQEQQRFDSPFVNEREKTQEKAPQA